MKIVEGRLCKPLQMARAQQLRTTRMGVRGNIPRNIRERACTCPAKMHAYSERGSLESGLLRKKALFRAYSAADWSYRAAECN